MRERGPQPATPRRRAHARQPPFAPPLPVRYSSPRCRKPASMWARPRRDPSSIPRPRTVPSPSAHPSCDRPASGRHVLLNASVGVRRVVSRLRPTRGSSLAGSRTDSSDAAWRSHGAARAPRLADPSAPRGRAPRHRDRRRARRPRDRGQQPRHRRRGRPDRQHLRRRRRAADRARRRRLRHRERAAGRERRPDQVDGNVSHGRRPVGPGGPLAGRPGHDRRPVQLPTARSSSRPRSTRPSPTARTSCGRTRSAPATP